MTEEVGIEGDGKVTIRWRGVSGFKKRKDGFGGAAL